MKMHLLTQINNFQHGEELVLKVQVLWRSFGAVILYEGEAACSQYLVVGPLHAPVKVGQSELVIVDGAVADTVRCPRWEFTLQQVAGQHLRGSWPRGCAAKRARKQGDLYKEAVYLPQKLLHSLSKISKLLPSMYFSSGLHVGYSKTDLIAIF